jgi:hypothetical protein
MSLPGLTGDFCASRIENLTPAFFGHSSLSVRNGETFWTSADYLGVHPEASTSSLAQQLPFELTTGSIA